jgi:hypothetical protein
MLIFLHILPTPPYTVAIGRTASLCPFQKKSMFARPANVGCKSFPPRATLSGTNRRKPLYARSGLKARSGSISQYISSYVPPVTAAVCGRALP